MTANADNGKSPLLEGPIPENHASYSDCAYAAQLREGVRWLRFEPTIEAAYRLHADAATLTRVRLLLLAGALTVLGFAIQNLLMRPPPLAAVAFAIDALLVAPSLGLLWGLSYTRWGAANATAIAVLAIVLVAATTLAIYAVATVHGLALPRENLLFLTLVAYLVAGLRLWHALALGVLILVAFVANELTWTTFDQASETLARYGLFLVSANVIGGLGAYAHEYTQRREFLMGRIIQAQAHRDGLTGLHNRQYLNEQLLPLWRQARRDGARLAVAIFDIDGFKSYNDTHGHLAGDECLRNVATAIAGRARRPFDIVVRYGGDEFVVVWYDIKPTAKVAELADQIRRDVADMSLPCANSAVPAFVSVSGGAAAAVPRSDDELNHLFTRADQALYEAKRRGRNQTVVASFTTVPSERQVSRLCA